MTDPGPTQPTSRHDYPPLSPFATGLLGRCPRCGKGAVFDGFLALRSRCEVCGLDLSVADTGDGPAFFASFIGSIVILGIAVYAEIAYEPSFWVYGVLLFFGALFVVGLIRPLKGILTSLQFTNKAAQGRFEP